MPNSAALGHIKKRWST